MKILIDPGHRNNTYDYGATGNGQKESAIALDVCKKLKKSLEEHKIVAYLSRENEAEIIGIDARYKKAKALDVDLLLSIHINSAANSSASGIEVLYKHENVLANDLCNAMYEATGAKNRGAKYRTDLGVLNGYTNSVLLELGFISNANECKLLASEAYQTKLVKAITDVIVKTYKITVDQEDTDLVKAVNEIISNGININAASWNKVESIKLANVPALLNKLGGTDNLIKQCIISSADIWLNGSYTKGNVRSLLIKYANVILGTA